MWTRDDQRRITWIFNCDSSISDHKWTIRYPCESHLISSLWQVSYRGSATKGSTTCSIVPLPGTNIGSTIVWTDKVLKRKSTSFHSQIHHMLVLLGMLLLLPPELFWSLPQQYVVALYHHKTGHGRWRSVILDEHTRQCTNYHSLCK